MFSTFSLNHTIPFKWNAHVSWRTRTTPNTNLTFELQHRTTKSISIRVKQVIVVDAYILKSIFVFSVRFSYECWHRQRHQWKPSSELWNTPCGHILFAFHQLIDHITHIYIYVQLRIRRARFFFLLLNCREFRLCHAQCFKIINKCAWNVRKSITILNKCFRMIVL